MAGPNPNPNPNTLQLYSLLAGEAQSTSVADAARLQWLGLPTPWVEGSWLHEYTKTVAFPTTEEITVNNGALLV